MQKNAALSHVNFQEAMKVAQILGFSPKAADALSTSAAIAHAVSPGDVRLRLSLLQS